MEIVGKVIEVLPVEKFNTKKGEMTKHRFVLETKNGDYTSKTCIECINEDRWVSMNIRVGYRYSVSIETSSREYEGKWYTTVSAWKAVMLEGGHTHTASQPQTSGANGNDEDPF